MKYSQGFSPRRIEKEKKTKALSMPPLSLGLLWVWTFLCFPRKGMTSQTQSIWKLCHYPIRERKIFFPSFSEWLNPSSYLLDKWFRLDEDQEMSGKRTTERHFLGSEMPIPDVTGPLPKLSPVNFVHDFPNLVEWCAVLNTRPPFH